ncbi:ATP-binding protein [Actinomycetospora termitidis]|uniref:ATP-binding protein n=1 Tax=Actinomycetospora termitidis TaxID=3053470 RepID=A0ABT7MFM0_9PSEU|nr:ATP-binding protein [Actinomycetospora sp. Odt1-22]MDL5159471.1 ATP-binding protein [Actinomycetospora sp. Odt1-22]
MFAPAVRAATYGRIALTGPSGAGKTYTALALAHLLADGSRPAVIDTERGKSQLYKGINGWDFDVACPQTYSPASLTEALGVAAGDGYKVLVVDSWSHYWSGVEGMQEQADRRQTGGNSFSGWKAARPDERRMIDAITSYPGHVIVTLRTKTAYVVEEIEQNGRRKSVPRKIGLKPEQRENIEYEFDLVCDMDLENTLTVSKTRLPMLRGAVIPEPGEELATTIRDWLADGEETMGPLAYRTEALADDVTVEQLRKLHADVRGAGLANAPVTDAEGHPMVLADLIVARGRQLGAGRPEAVAG